MKKNLADIIERAKARGIRVLLAGFEAPPDSRDEYLQEFVAVFPELAREHEVALLPSFLAGVAGVTGSTRKTGSIRTRRVHGFSPRTSFAPQALLSRPGHEEDP
jgi:lysophospholipase L1-like esterase